MEKTHRIMLIHLRIFCELTSACFNADALQVRYRISSRCTKLLVPLTRCVRLCEGQWTRRVLVVYPSIVEARHTPQETINYQGRARGRERAKRGFAAHEDRYL